VAAHMRELLAGGNSPGLASGNSPRRG
jgi:hypothetical protein